ncbi:MAG: M48 family metalloprotease [Burkholderiales bacterium]
MRFAFALFLCLALTPLFAETIAPYPNAAALDNISEEENRIWNEGEEFDEQLKRSGLINSNDEVTKYVQGVMDKLFPEFDRKIRVQVLKSPYLNAFALPNGSIYINQGLLSRFENEAQLATVLAHEGTHFTHRHGFHLQRTVKTASLVNLVTRLMGLPQLVELVIISSMLGYTRELETEADNEGYKRVVAAGYDVHETPKVFEHLVRELKAADVKEPFFFSTHPKLQDRVDNFKKLSEGTPDGGIVREPEYVEHVTDLRLANLQNELTHGRSKHVLLALCDEERLSDYPPSVHYYIGEAYRLRGAQGDEVSAEIAYLKALEQAPNFAATYRALGVLYLKQKDYAHAAPLFEKYLAMAPEAKDREYVVHYLERAKNGGAPN